jgi:hypothetical protein
VLLQRGVVHVSIDLVIEPSCADILQQCRAASTGTLAGYTMEQWRTKTRSELGLATDRAIIATGHQSLLWHPGILVKYMLVDALAQAHDLATANLVVDQHAGDYASFDVPIRRRDGALATRTLTLARVGENEPMGLHEPFTPPRPPEHLSLAIPDSEAGIRAIYETTYAHRDAPNAALQMAGALEDLMQRWVRRMPNITATDLGETSLARALMQMMADDPWRCVESYNRAVRAVPESGIGPLMVRDDYVELPLWRIREDKRRMYAYDNDVQAVLDGGEEAPPLLPRALFMTAVMRLGMCDLFVHGTGGGRYDRAMELWIADWLGLTVAPKAVASATLTLDLQTNPPPPVTVAQAQRNLRRLEHDPESIEHERASIGPRKAMLLEAIQEAPRRSMARREAFHHLHETLRAMRDAAADAISAARRELEHAMQHDAEQPIVQRRTWAFPLYLTEQLDALHAAVRQRIAAPCRTGCS